MQVLRAPPVLAADLQTWRRPSAVEMSRVKLHRHRRGVKDADQWDIDLLYTYIPGGGGVSA